jgi:hypothetical protein
MITLKQLLIQIDNWDCDIDEAEEFIKIYTIQEVNKHLEIAADEAFIDDFCGVINRQSITNIKIELT